MFNLFFKNKINFDEALEEFKNTENAFLIDVREKDEYRQGHVPKSINVPLSNIDKIKNVVKDKNAKLYIYCLSGVRSRQACHYFKTLGYSNTKDLGGINSYSGRIER